MELALDIGSKYVHLIEGKMVKGKCLINKCHSVLLPEGYVVDGEITNPEELAKLIKVNLKQLKVRSKKVAISMNSSQVIIRDLTLPEVKPKEIHEVVRQELFSFLSEGEQYLIDYQNVVYLEGQKMMLQGVAVPTFMVKGYRDFVKYLECRPERLNIHINSVANFASQYSVNIDCENYMIVDIGNSNMVAHLFVEGKRVFSRSIVINTGQYEKTLVSLDAIETLDKSFYELDLSLEHLNVDMLLGSTLLPYLNNINLEIQALLQYQLSTHPKAFIKKILLCGGMANMKGLCKNIEEFTSIPTYSLDEIAPLKDQKMNLMAPYVNAIGAMISRA